MKLDKAQWCWLLYDPGNAAYALLVRAVFAPLFFVYCARGVCSESQATASWGLLCSGAGIFAGACSLYFGTLADARSRRKSALLTATVLGAAAAASLALVSDYRAVMIIYFISLAAYMAGNSFYDSLLISVARPSEYSLLSTFAYGFGYLGGLLPFLGILAAGFALGDKIITARVAFVLAAVWWMLFTIPLAAGVREVPPAEKASLRWYDGFSGLWKTLKEVFANSNTRLFLIAYFLYIDGVSTILMMAAPISVEIGMSEQLLMLTILGLQVIGFPSTIAFGNLAVRFGARRMVYSALVIYVMTASLIGVLTLCRSAEAKLVCFLTAAFLIALAQGGIQSLSRSLFGLLVPEAKAAEFFSVYNIFGKFTTILGPVLIYFVSMIWQRSEYGIVLLIIPFTVGGFMLSKVKFPDGEKV